VDKGYLYKITHTPTGMLYFGSRKTPEGVSVSADTYMGSPVGSNRMRELFDTRPDTEFEKEILTVGLYADIVEMEPLLIQESWDKFGHEHEGGLVCNLVAWGHFVITDKVRAKMSAAREGFTHTQEAKDKISAANTGKIRTEAAKDRMSMAQSRPETKAKRIANKKQKGMDRRLKAMAEGRGIWSLPKYQKMAEKSL